MGLGVSCVFRCDLVVTTGKAVPPLAVFAIVPSVLPRELRYRISSLSGLGVRCRDHLSDSHTARRHPATDGQSSLKERARRARHNLLEPGHFGPHLRRIINSYTKPTASFDNVPTLARPVPTRAAIRGACTLAFELGCQGCSTATTEFARAHSSLGPSAAVTRGNVTMIPHSLKHYSCRYIRVAYCIRVRDNKETTLAT